MTRYQFQVRGHLDVRWEAMFEGLCFTHQVAADGEPFTEMNGHVVDQAALYGTITRLRNLGVELISIQPLSSDGELGSEQDENRKWVSGSGDGQ